MFGATAEGKGCYHVPKILHILKQENGVHVSCVLETSVLLLVSQVMCQAHSVVFPQVATLRAAPERRVQFFSTFSMHSFHPL